ncbi:MAG TPA: TlpA disulfide reductase family protein [Pyrinomonadaceae bacterium]
MRKTLPLMFLLALFAAHTAAQSGRRLKNPPPPRAPEPIPESLTATPKTTVPTGPLNRLPEGLLNRPFESLEKGTFRLADFIGKVIVVNLWATWCGPCRREVPEYERVRKQFADRGVEFIGLTTEDPITTRARVQKFVRDFNFKFRIGWADGDTAHLLMNGRNVIPQTLVIASDGRIISHWSGYSPQSAGRLRTAIESALSDNSPATESH